MPASPFRRGRSLRPPSAAVRRAVRFRRPWLVIAGRRGTDATAQDRPPRVIGEGRAGHVRLMLLLPSVAATFLRARHLVDRVMQPGMPFRRHLGRLRLTLIDDPALLAARPSAAAPQRVIAPLAVIAVA